MSLRSAWANIQAKEIIKRDLAAKRERNHPMNEALKNITQSAVVTALESPETMVLKKVSNLGAPPEGSGITIVTKTRKLSDTVAECAESKETPGVWLYNRPAFDQLVKMWVIALLSEEQLLAYINAIPGNAEAKAKVMNGEDEPFPGCLSAGNGKLIDRGGLACWWVVSSVGSARCVYLDRGNQIAGSGSSNPRDGFLVPVSADKK